jgi:ferritin
MNKDLYDAFNTQLNYELESAFVYLAMANFASDLGFDGFENWFYIQYQEELEHAKKMMIFLNERGQRVQIKGFDSPKNNYESLLDAFETGLEHEKGVTSRIHNLYDIALTVKDFSSMSFLQWYIDEQVEEESNFEKLIDALKLVKDQGLYMLDKELATRVHKSILVNKQ